MSRKQSNVSREILPDPKFHSEMITRFINMVMISGKRSVAEKIVYGAIDTISEKNKTADAVELVEKALENEFYDPVIADPIAPAILILLVMMPSWDCAALLARG